MPFTSIYKTVCAATLLTMAAACDKDFEQINVNPVLPTTLDPGYLLPTAQLNAVLTTLLYESQIVQQINTPFTGVLEGGNHNVVYDPNSSAAFNTLYVGPGNNGSGPIKLLTDLIDKTKDDPQRTNLYNMGRIWKAYVFSVLTDTYGDVPYFEAGKAFLEGINRPTYDDQQEIYADITKELQEATDNLNASNPTESGDLLYQGDIEKWKRLGNSLLLRVGMRYSAVDPGRAEELVRIATDPARGGVMQSVDDNARLAFDETYTSPTGSTWHGTERANYYLGQPFVNFLKASADPRLEVIAVKYQTPANPLATAGAANTNPADQEGMPYGYNESSISTAPGFPGKIGAAFAYSQINRSTLGKITAPEFFVTYAQTQLLLAEAAFRGWATGDAAAFYAAGVRAHMDQMQQYDASAAIAANDQDDYLAAHPFDAANALEQINSQYWVASFLNGSEAWANFRRSNYPALTPNTYPGKDPAVTDFINRLVYPARERSVNVSGIEAAVARMGADNLGTRVFWDAP